MQSRGQTPGRGQGIRVHGLAETPVVGRNASRSATPRPEVTRSTSANGVEPPPVPRPRREPQPPVDAYPSSFARIKVIGVGGAGGNAINRMIGSGVDGIEFVSVNTDAQALLTSHAPLAIRIGDKMTKGLGAGGRPEIGTPLRADWAIVCGESTPLAFGLDTFGSAGVVGRSGGGV
jgi:hypothetical protein